MIQLTGRNNVWHRILAVLLSVLMLLQTVCVYAENPETAESIPVAAESAEEKAEIPADHPSAAEENNRLPEGNGSEANGPTESTGAGVSSADEAVIQTETSDNPAEDSGIMGEKAKLPTEGSETLEDESGRTAETGETTETGNTIPCEPAAAAEPTPIIDSSESVTMFMPGFVPKPLWFEGILVHEGPDYTVTATIGKEAKLPADITMRVAEILPGTEIYEHYREIMAETLEEDEEIGDFARIFDIAFITVVDGEETEIEPQTEIDVQITFREAIAVTEETDVQAVHFEENTPEIMDVSTDSLEAAANDDEAIDTLTFSSDSFSVYGFFQKVKKTVKVITASGATFTVDVTFNSDAGIPDDAELIATEITPNDANYDIYREQTALALGADDVKLPGLFDLGIYVNGEKIQPEAPVSVAISLNEGIQEGEKLYVVHFPEGIEAAKEPEPAEAATKLMAAPRMMRAAAPMTQPAEQQATEQQTTEKQDTEAAEPETQNETPAVATEVVSEVAVEGETVTFAANGFSVYALAYTIQTYYRTASGETYLITMNYSSDAGIPENAELAVREILPGETGYENYLAGASEAATTDAVNRGMEVPMISGARLFDIEILADGEKIEPAAPVQVTIELAGEAADMMSVIHFAETGTEAIPLTKTETAGETQKVAFDADSFSVYSVVNINNWTNLNGKKYAIVSGIAGDNGATTGYSESWGRDYFTLIVNANALGNEEKNNGLSADGVHVWTDSTGSYVGGEVTEWYFESYPNDNGAYRIYTYINGTRYYFWQNSNNGLNENVGLTTNANWASHLRFEPVNDGTGRVWIQQAGWYLHNNGVGNDGEWSSRNYMMQNTGYGPSGNDFKFRLCQYSENFDSFAARKVSVQELQQNNDFIIYRKFQDDQGNETLYALAHDGTFVRVYDGGDSVYWRETDKNVYWNYINTGNGYVIKGKNEEIYLNPKHSTERTISTESVALTLPGFENGEYGTAIENWDQEAYDYAGLHVTNSNGTATLGTGTRAADTSDMFLFAIAGTMPTGNKETVATVDSAALGIHITMFDYGDLNYVPPAGEKLGDMTNAVGNEDYYPRAANSLVTRYLTDGVPTSKTKGAMTSLFKTNGSVVRSHTTEVTNLFLKSYYDESGTFRYRSEDNYAYLPNGSKKFTVYRQVATPYTTDNSLGHTYYYHGHFMPYNDIDMTQNLSRLMNQYGNYYEDGTAIGELPIGDGRAYEEVYGVIGTPNYFTGMKMEANFVQPRGGKLANGDDMVFKFTGDDDMWVYIDDVLVLDIGGIHEPLSGTINFATGTVTNPSGSSLAGTKTLYQIFMDTLNSGSTPETVKEKIRAIKWKDANGDGRLDTFADYTSHSFSSFYMERGAGASNLDIQFNLQVVREKEFDVRKELPEGVDPRFANREFAFTVEFTDIDDNPLTYEEACSNVVFRKADGSEITEKTINPDGTFTLRAGEYAEFKIKNESYKYNVKETGIDTDWTEKVAMNGTDVAVQNGEAQSGFEMVADRIQVVCMNTPFVQNLKITKHIEGGIAEDDDPRFEFRVYFEAMDPDDGVTHLVPYSYGPYYLMKDGNYYTLTGTNNAPESHGTTPTVCSTTGRSGTINSIPPEYTIVIPNLTVGTNFYVEERRDNMPEGYAFIREVLTAGTYDPCSLDTTDIHLISRLINDQQHFNPNSIGRIKKGADAESHIYNGRSAKIHVKKEWEEEDSEEVEHDPVTVRLIRLKSSAEVPTPVLSGTLNLTHVMTGYNGSLPSGFVYTASNGEKTQTLVLGNNTLPVGTYTLTVNADGADHPSTHNHISTSVNPPTVTITLGGTASATVTSEYTAKPVPVGTLRLTHTMNGYNGSLPNGFVYTATDSNGIIYSWSETGDKLLPVGTYTLSVDASAVSHPSTHDHTGTTINPPTVTISENGYADAEVTSTYTAKPVGTLHLTHTKTGYNNSMPSGFVFTATNKATGETHQLATDTKLPPGTYTLTANADGVNHPIGYQYNGTTFDRQPVTITAGTTTNVTATSTYSVQSAPEMVKVNINYGKYSINTSLANNAQVPKGSRIKITIASHHGIQRASTWEPNTNAGFWNNDNLINYQSDTVIREDVYDGNKYSLTEYTYYVTVNKDINIGIAVADNCSQYTVEASYQVINSSLLKTKYSFIATNGVAVLGSNSGEDETSDDQDGYVVDSYFTPIILELNKDNNWSGYFTDLDYYDEDGREYYYMVEEVPVDGYTTTYSSNLPVHATLSTPDEPVTVEIINTKIPTKGPLKLKKLVTVNGSEPTDENKAFTDGTYEFKITRSGETTVLHTVQIEYANGVITGAKLNGNNKELTEDGFVQLNGILAGSYVITETQPLNGTNLSKVEMGAASDLGNRTITVIVTAGSSVPDDAATAVFTNNIDTQDLVVEKVWTDGVHTEGQITYTLYRIPKAGDMEYEPVIINPAGYTGILKASEWSETITNLPKTGVYTVNAGTTSAETVAVTYSYYVSEGTVSGYRSTTRGVWSDDGKTYTVTITNTPHDSFDTETDISIRKDWQDEEGNTVSTGHENDIITFRVKQNQYAAADSDGKKIYPVRVKLQNGDGNYVDHPPVFYVPDGSRFSLTIHCGNNGHKVRGNGFDNDAEEKDGHTFYISSVDEAREVTLKPKNDGDVWGESASGNTWTFTVGDSAYTEGQMLGYVDAGGEPTGASEFEYSMKLNESKDDAVLTRIGDDAQGTGTGTGIWSGSITNLPLFSKEGTDYYVYTYEIIEVKIGDSPVSTENVPAGYDGQTAVYLVKWEGSSGTWTITNRKKREITVTVKKLDQENLNTEGAPTLAGATFVLEKYLAADYAEKDPLWTIQTIPDSQNTTAGVFIFNNLTEGYYLLKETVNPPGYIPSATYPRFRIKEESGSLRAVLIDQNGQEIARNATETLVVENATIKVGNRPGAALPSTGGSGTTAYTLAGLALMALAGTILAKRKRREQ